MDSCGLTWTLGKPEKSRLAFRGLRRADAEVGAPLLSDRWRENPACDGIVLCGRQEVAFWHPAFIT
jgi:hypothetical protein